MEQYTKELENDIDPPRLWSALSKMDSNIQDAMLELEALVEEGSTFALTALGSIHLYGNYGASKNEKLGVDFLQRAMEEGSIEGAYRRACFLDSKAQHSEAFDIYEDLAGKGFSPALYRLAWAYHDGRWVKRDKAKSRELFAKASEAGHLLAKQKLSFDLRGSEALSEKLEGYFHLLTLWIPRAMQHGRQPLSDRLRD